jgi:hypothetical protein
VGRNTDAKGVALLNYVASEPVKNLFSSQLFSKLREEDTKEQTELTNATGVAASFTANTKG